MLRNRAIGSEKKQRNEDYLLKPRGQGAALLFTPEVDASFTDDLVPRSSLKDLGRFYY